VRRLDDHRLPKSKEERQAEAEKIGVDGRHELLDAVLPAPHNRKPAKRVYQTTSPMCRPPRLR
jgi:hypothetical protein